VPNRVFVPHGSPRPMCRIPPTPWAPKAVVHPAVPPIGTRRRAFDRHKPPELRAGSSRRHEYGPCWSAWRASPSGRFGGAVC
jgi:hypothetical protein